MAQSGYFTDAAQTVPAFDPGPEVPCPVCGEQLSSPLKTISLMLEADARSYFYRTHKTCYESLGEEQRGALDGIIIDAIAAAKNVN